MKLLIPLIFIALSVLGCKSTTENESKPQGFVKLSFDIDEQGKPMNINIIESEPKKVFDKAAVNALEKWRYDPKIVNGVAVKQTNQTVKLDFKLEK